ncbi:MFS transporter [Nonomuraea zeae]|uniref:Putative proline/betaine transporter n=1 Tax=Nonomuraea zeae TaxID=1642303 RepID=A0A5S4GMH4_9ACTN|nr:MFS transporter [Nonomuraea zeae]TMR34146.1 MHS family MFS transporter [Nonomuraea zeae]
MAQPSSSTRVVLASLAGTTIEWYEFFIYGTAAVLVFDKLFFPSYDDVVGTLLSLSTFALAFVARPIGGALFGHFGDRLGRKSMLVVTLCLMGGATLCIGLLPTYETIGVAAPILLVALRVVQGLSLGGEYGGAVLMSVEHAARTRRGFFGALVNTGAAWGLLLANLVFLLTSQLSDDAFLSWGWRVPFLLSAVLVGLGLLIRLKLAESPDFQEVRERGEVRKTPIAEVLSKHWPRVLLMCLAYIPAGVTFYIATVYSLSYGEKQLGLDRDMILQLVLLVNVFTIVAIPFFGWLSDRVDRKRIFWVSIVAMAALPYAWFSLFQSGSFGLMLAGFVLLFIPYAANYGTMPAFFAHVFPPAVRYTGMSVGYTLGTVFGSGLAPIIATWLYGGTGSWLAIAVYMTAAGAAGTVAALFLTERHSAETKEEVPA